MTAIRCGTALNSPEGFECLVKSVEYYFLCSHTPSDRVFLVEFIVHPPKLKKYAEGKFKSEQPQPMAILHAMRRSRFEWAVREGLIQVAVEQRELPKWLEGIKEKSTTASVASEREKALSHQSRIDRRLKILAPLISEWESVLKERDPTRALHRLVKQHAPAQNMSRVRSWLLAYLTFNNNRLALHYSTYRIGHWDRDNPSSKKYGRPSTVKGKSSGVNINSNIRLQILNGYQAYSKRGQCIKDIYVKTIRKEFGCRSRVDALGMKEFYHPEGQPFPSEYQFDYHVRKEIGTQEIHLRRFGENRVRSGKVPSLGSFSEQLSNLMEKVELDGYYLKEIARGLLDETDMPPLCVVRMRCSVSGAIVGIGFGFGSERSAAYRMATFCAAVDKVKFCALFGITIRPEEWPTIGAPGYTVVDRGPGAVNGAYSFDEQYMPAIRELAPAYAGQAKAAIETTHPENDKVQDGPELFRSPLKVLELVRREIRRVLIDNDTIDISHRIPFDFLNRVRKPSPIELWNALAKVGRDDGLHMSFEKAVRAFLSPVKAVVKPDGVYLNGQLFCSQELHKSGLLGRVATTQTTVVTVYLFEVNVRHIWTDYEGKLLSLDVMVPLRSKDDVKHVSLIEIQEREAFLKTTAIRYREHRLAARAEQEDAFYEDTGKEWDAGARKKGRSKRHSRDAMREKSELALALQGKPAQ